MRNDPKDPQRENPEPPPGLLPDGTLAEVDEESSEFDEETEQDDEDADA